MSLGRFFAVLLVAAGLLPAVSRDLQTQSPPASVGTLDGRVAKYGDGLAGVEVTLHQVTPQASGVVASQTTGSGGSFRFQLPPGEPGAFNVFFVTVDHLGVRYFGDPVHANQAPPLYTVEVYDTTAAAPGAVHVGRRDIILYPESGGDWSGNELIRAVNPSDRTLVSGGGAPTWEFLLPAGASEFEITEGMVGPEDLRVIGDRVVFTGSVPPGERELFVRYRLLGDPSRMSLETIARTDTLNVYMPETTPGVRVTGLVSTQVITAEGERFVRYAAADLPPGHAIVVTWASTRPPIDPVHAGVGVALVILAIGTWLAVRNRNQGRAGATTHRAPVPVDASPNNTSESRRS